jgi:hypothetical protein
MNSKDFTGRIDSPSRGAKLELLEVKISHLMPAWFRAGGFLPATPDQPLFPAFSIGHAARHDKIRSNPTLHEDN